MSSKRYGQFCGLARSLDRVGERWTLLIIRELLTGDRTYVELLRALPGLATNVLAGRLRDLEEAGILERVGARRRKGGRYRLSTLGHGLEPAILALIRWGSVWMQQGPGSDYIEDGWAPLAVKAVLEGAAAGKKTGAVEFRVGTAAPFSVVVNDGRREVRPASASLPDAVVFAASLPDLLAAVSTGAVGASAGLRIEGDRSLARQATSAAS